MKVPVYFIVSIKMSKITLNNIKNSLILSQTREKYTKGTSHSCWPRRSYIICRTDGQTDYAVAIVSCKFSEEAFRSSGLRWLTASRRFDRPRSIQGPWKIINGPWANRDEGNMLFRNVGNHVICYKTRWHGIENLKILLNIFHK
jgi:hypothetical protein